MYLVQLESGLQGVTVYVAPHRRWHRVYTEVDSSFFYPGKEMLYVQGGEKSVVEVNVDANVCRVAQFQKWAIKVVNATLPFVLFRHANCLITKSSH